jgi:uncharacterized protein with HEPN domain
MLRVAGKVSRYSVGIDRATFERDAMKYGAILRNPELIGQAATPVPAEVREQPADIPWQPIIATRNRLRHGHRQRHAVQYCQ